MTTQDTKKSNLYKVPTDLIEMYDDFNLRLTYDENKQEELINSIEENGIINDVKGYKENGKFIVIDGHRRVKAAKELVRRKREESESDFDIRVPFSIQTGGGESQQTLNMLIYNEGEPFTPLEIADGVRRLVQFGMEFSEIAQKLQKSQAYIYRLYKLVTNAAPEVRKAIISGEMEATTAMGFIESCTTQREQIEQLNEIRQEVEDDKTNEAEKNNKGSQQKPKKNSSKITNKNVSKKQNLEKALKDIDENHRDLIDLSKLDLLEKAVNYQKGKVNFNTLLLALQEESKPATID